MVCLTAVNNYKTLYGYHQQLRGLIWRTLILSHMVDCGVLD